MTQLERRFDVQLISHESLAGYMTFRGHTVRTLAKQVGVSHALIGFLRSGHRRSCSPRTARAIAAALNCLCDAVEKVGSGETALTGSNAELCGGPSWPSERAPS